MPQDSPARILRTGSSINSTCFSRKLRPRSEDAALFADMLSIPNDGRYPTLDLTAQQQRQRTLEALDLQLEAFARRSPVLMIFEDAHWTDPTSLEARSGSGPNSASRVLLIVTFRPEFQPPWIGQRT